MTCPRAPIVGLLAAAALGVVGCAGKPYDYTNYRAHFPRSILILPPVNESTDVKASYSYLSTLSLPVAELGYYVFPVAVIDQFLKDNGMPTPGEMHQVPLNKVQEITGADAVLFVTVTKYGAKYQVIASTTTVEAEARLVDTRTGTLLWAGKTAAIASYGGTDVSGAIIAAVEQVVGQATDRAHSVAHDASEQLAREGGLLHGPYSPKYGGD